LAVEANWYTFTNKRVIPPAAWPCWQRTDLAQSTPTGNQPWMTTRFFSSVNINSINRLLQYIDAYADVCYQINWDRRW
jgi:hypothetical protein